MGQERWMFRVGVYGLAKDFVPGPGDAEAVRSRPPPSVLALPWLSRGHEES